MFLITKQQLSRSLMKRNVEIKRRFWQNSTVNRIALGRLRQKVIIVEREGFRKRYDAKKKKSKGIDQF